MASLGKNRDGHQIDAGTIWSTKSDKNASSGQFAFSVTPKRHAQHDSIGIRQAIVFALSSLGLDKILIVENSTPLDGEPLTGK